MSDDQILIDVAGNELAVGDTVVYPQMSGRSVQMVLGIFKGYNGKTAKIERTEGSRWSAEYTRTRFRDKRTGKGIDPYATKKHFKVEPSSWYVHKETGEKISYDEGAARYRASWTTGTGWDATKWKYHHDRGEYQDYVEEYTAAPKPVTIQNVTNIVKVVPHEG